MLPEGYDPKDIKNEINRAILSGYRMAVVDAISLCDNLDVYASDSLLAHKVSVDEDNVSEVRTIVQDWMTKMLEQVIISLIDSEVNCDED